MPVQNIGGVITETPASGMDKFLQTGVFRADQFAAKDTIDVTKQVNFDCSKMTTGTTCTIQPQSGTSGNVTLPSVANPALSAVGSAGTLQYVVATEAGSATVTAGNTNLVLDPAAGLTTFSVTFPTTPPDGYRLSFSTTATLTNLNLLGGGSDTFKNAITTLAANASASYVYRATGTKWYKI